MPGVRDDVIAFVKVGYKKEFSTFNIDESSAGNVLLILTQIRRTYWDYFIRKGIKRVIFGNDFSIDTGDSTFLCCKNITMIHMSQQS